MGRLCGVLLILMWATWAEAGVFNLITPPASSTPRPALSFNLIEEPQPPLPTPPSYNRNSYDLKLNIVWRDSVPRGDCQQWWFDDRFALYWRSLRPDEDPITLKTPADCFLPGGT